MENNNYYYKFTKRLVDVLASILGLVLLSPVLLMITIIMKLQERKGSVFFCQERIGQYGKKFKIYKFRSMRIDADNYLRKNQELYQKYIDNGYKLEQSEDPRITKLGGFLRRTSLDELPQLINVFKGDMSLVGPRPIILEEIQEYEKVKKEQEFLSMKPGITGVWQTSGRSNISYPDRVYLEISYVKNSSIFFDMKLIFKTLIKVLKKREHIKMKKKIVLISEPMGGGVRKHVVQLLENLDKNQFEIFFIHGIETRDEQFVDKYDSLKQNCIMIPCKYMRREINIWNDLKSIKFILKQLKIIQPDIVHCHSSKAGVLGRIASRIQGVNKIFYTPHAYSFLAPEFSNNKKRIFIAIEKLLSRLATTTTFNVSKGERNSAIRLSLDNPEKFAVVYNGLPQIVFVKNTLKKELGLPIDSFIIGNTARLSSQKNPMLFVEIAKEIIVKYKNIHFVWAGNGPLYEKVSKYIDTNELSDNIHLLGDRKDSELIIADFNIFLTTSLYEGLPYAPIEAKRAGVPILATNVTGNNEIVEPFETGMLFEINELNQALNLIESMIDGRIELSSEKIINEYKTKFSMNSMLTTITDNYLK